MAELAGGSHHHREGGGYQLCQDLRSRGELRLREVTPKTSKEDRFNGCLGEVEAGHFLLPREAPWLDTFKAELKAFPNGKHDDQADSFSQFVKFQPKHWTWLLTEIMPDGRARDLVRLDKLPW